MTECNQFRSLGQTLYTQLEEEVSLLETQRANLKQIVNQTKI